MAEKTSNPTTPPSRIPGASDPNTMAEDMFGPNYMTPEQMAAAEVPAGTDAPGPEGATTLRSRSFTNIAANFDKPGWTFVSPEGQKFVVNKGVVESTGYLPGAAPADLGFSPGYVTDPRLGMAPQGEWTLDKMRTMFPETFDTKFQEKYREIDPANLPETQMPDGSPAAPTTISRQDIPTEADRSRFETIIFKQTGNPFLIDLNADLRRADADLPTLFNNIFSGVATYRDMAKLSPEQRKYWEAAKLQHMSAVHDWSVNRRKQAMEQYEYAMTTFDRRAKELKTAADKADAEAAAELARAGKMPGHIFMRNAEGKETLHVWDPKMVDPATGQMGALRDTKQEKGDAPFMPPRVAEAKAFIMQFAKLDPTTAALAAFSEATGQKNTQMSAMIAKGRMAVQEDLRWKYDNALSIWMDWEKKNNAFVPTPTAATAAPAKRTADDAIKGMVSIVRGGGSISNAMQALFLEEFGPEAYDKLKKELAPILVKRKRSEAQPVMGGGESFFGAPSKKDEGSFGTSTKKDEGSFAAENPPSATSVVGEDPFAQGVEQVGISMQEGIEAGQAKIGEVVSAAGQNYSRIARATAEWLSKTPAPSNFAQFKDKAKMNKEGTVWAPYGGVVMPVLVKPDVSDTVAMQKYLEALVVMGLK